MARWLELKCQIDYLYFELGEIHKNMPKSPIDKMIDNSTGYEKERRARITQICVEMKELKKEWNKLTGDTATTEMEDALLKELAQ